MKRREYVLYTKKKKRLYSTIRLLCVSVAPFWRVSTEHKLRTLFCVSRSTRIRCFHSNQSVNKCRRRIRAVRLTQNSVRSLHSVDTVQWWKLVRSEKGDKLTGKLIHIAHYTHNGKSNCFIGRKCYTLQKNAFLIFLSCFQSKYLILKSNLFFFPEKRISQKILVFSLK